MKNAIKGALLSGLILPGLGQVVLRRYRRGAVIILVVLASLFAAVVTAVQHALVILENIQSRGGDINMQTISDAATRASSTSVSLIFNLALLMIIFCWIFGIIDAYRIGRNKDIEEDSTAPA
jgi:hypothetical protein